MRQIAVRLPEDLIEELDELVEGLGEGPLVRAERSAVIRYLLTEALEARRRKK